MRRIVHRMPSIPDERWLHIRYVARKVRDLRRCGDHLQNRISMKSSFSIANPTALRPNRHGTAACGLPRDERARKDFVPHD
ncbi:hypothetical protein ACFPN1_13295 [Lysobacter yangpyeongensis]|uniref:Uncharacterized protein n=1 Tax=Lysobacter yangpyeongensis TaxID=346182 RepID=A0ABW0SQH6_9GAMM